MRALLSIKPEFADKIFSGSKRFEYRKLPFKKRVTSVVVYSSSPTQKIIGEFTVERVIEGSPDDVWRKTKKYSGISEEFFKRYFDGKSKAYAIEIKEFIKYPDAIDPYKTDAGFTPPQSYKYLPNETEKSAVQLSLL